MYLGLLQNWLSQKGLSDLRSEYSLARIKKCQVIIVIICITREVSHFYPTTIGHCTANLLAICSEETCKQKIKR